MKSSMVIDMLCSVNMVFFLDSIVPKIWIGLPQQFPMRFRHTRRVAIENLLFEKLLIFSPLLSSSKYIVGATAIVRLFVANVSKQKPSHTSLPWPRWWCAVHKCWTFCCAIRYFQYRKKHLINSTGAKSQSKTPSSQYKWRCLRGY